MCSRHDPLHRFEQVLNFRNWKRWLREDAVRIVLNVTDDGDDCGTVGTGDGGCSALEMAAVEGLNREQITYVGINSNETESEFGGDAKARALMEYLTKQTGSLNSDGIHLWFAER